MAEERQIACPLCGKIVLADDWYCYYCNAPIAAKGGPTYRPPEEPGLAIGAESRQAKCLCCGESNPEHRKFCVACGARLSDGKREQPGHPHANDVRPGLALDGVNVEDVKSPEAVTSDSEGPIKKCSRCGTANLSRNRFCHECGWSFSIPWITPTPALGDSTSKINAETGDQSASSESHPQIGYASVPSIYCTRCGTGNEPAARFCCSCGNALYNPQTPPLPSSAPAPAKLPVEISDGDRIGAVISKCFKLYCKDVSPYLGALLLVGLLSLPLFLPVHLYVAWQTAAAKTPEEVPKWIGTAYSGVLEFEQLLFAPFLFAIWGMYLSAIRGNPLRAREVFGQAKKIWRTAYGAQLIIGAASLLVYVLCHVIIYFTGSFKGSTVLDAITNPDPFVCLGGCLVSVILAFLFTMVPGFVVFGEKKAFRAVVLSARFGIKHFLSLLAIVGMQLLAVLVGLIFCGWGMLATAPLALLFLVGLCESKRGEIQKMIVGN